MWTFVSLISITINIHSGASQDKHDLYSRLSELKCPKTNDAMHGCITDRNKNKNFLPLQPIPEETHFRKVQNFWFRIAQLHEAL